MADEPLNQKLLLMFLRLWRNPETGKARYTFQEIAEAFGYKDRRNVHNYWAEFVACGKQFLAFLLRKRKVDGEVVEVVQAELRVNISSPLTELCKRTNARLERSDLTVDNIKAALEQIPCRVIRNQVVRQWEQGQLHLKEEVVLEQALGALAEGEEPSRQRALGLLSGVGIKAPLVAEEELVQQQQREVVTVLLRPDVAVSSLSEEIRQMVIFGMCPCLGLACGWAKARVPSMAG